jgi:hypothetical protein
MLKLALVYWLLWLRMKLVVSLVRATVPEAFGRVIVWLAVRVAVLRVLV